MRKTACLVAALFGFALAGCGSSTVTVPNEKIAGRAVPPAPALLAGPWRPYRA